MIWPILYLSEWIGGGCDRRCERGAVRTEHEHGTHHVDSEGEWHPSPSY